MFFHKLFESLRCSIQHYTTPLMSKHSGNEVFVATADTGSAFLIMHVSPLGKQLKYFVTTRTFMNGCCVTSSDVFRHWAGISPWLPTSVEMIMFCVAHMHARSLSPTSIVSIVSAVAYFHKVNGFPTKLFAGERLWVLRNLTQKSSHQAGGRRMYEDIHPTCGS